jgi:hypothetical protein
VVDCRAPGMRPCTAGGPSEGGDGFAGRLDVPTALSERSPRPRAVRGCVTRGGWRTDALGSNWVRTLRSESRAARPDAWWVCGNGRRAMATGLLRLADRRPGRPAAVRTASPHAHAVPGKSGPAGRGRRVNIEARGNTDQFLHTHVWPRYGWEPQKMIGRPGWLYPPERVQPCH